MIAANKYIGDVEDPMNAVDAFHEIITNAESKAPGFLEIEELYQELLDQGVLPSDA